MIYLTGDTHGDYDLRYVEEFFRTARATKEDYLIILGDVACVWDGKDHDAGIRERLHNLPPTVLWLDGNHENHTRIDALLVTEMFGGRVQVVDEMNSDLIHLMRGEVYRIEDKCFFVFGGGFSIDKVYRTEDVSWWAREMPSEEEYERGLVNLAKAGNAVDVILTHTAPTDVCRLLVPHVLPGEEALQEYLRGIEYAVDFKQWYFGHWHMDRRVDERFLAMYHNVVML